MLYLSIDYFIDVTAHIGERIFLELQRSFGAYLILVLLVGSYVKH
jgi:hypothetical protein